MGGPELEPRQADSGTGPLSILVGWLSHTSTLMVAIYTCMQTGLGNYEVPTTYQPLYLSYHKSLAHHRKAIFIIPKKSRLEGHPPPPQHTKSGTVWSVRGFSAEDPLTGGIIADSPLCSQSMRQCLE